MFQLNYRRLEKKVVEKFITCLSHNFYGLKERFLSSVSLAALKAFVFSFSTFSRLKFVGENTAQASFLINFHPFLTVLLAIVTPL